MGDPEPKPKPAGFQILDVFSYFGIWYTSNKNEEIFRGSLITQLRKDGKSRPRKPQREEGCSGCSKHLLLDIRITRAGQLVSVRISEVVLQ